MFKSLAKLFSKKSNQTYDEIKNEKKKTYWRKNS